MEQNPIILVVDDVKLNRDLIGFVLKDKGYICEEAENGAQAVARAKELLPDVILMDIMMPEMDGLIATKLLREDSVTHRIPVLIITALDDKEDRIRAYEAGAMDFVTKPFDRHELLARVGSYSKLSRLNKQYVLSTKNPDTQLPNKNALLDELKDYASPKMIAVKINELDKIKHMYGDRISIGVQKQFAHVLTGHAPLGMAHAARVFHIFHQYFIMLWDDVSGDISKEAIVGTCKELIAKVEGLSITVEDYEFDITISIGISMSHDASFEQLEIALDEAEKEESGFVVTEDIINDVYMSIENNMFWIKTVRDAIRDGRIEPFFQPIINNATGIIEKYEALVRLTDEYGIAITPHRFLPILKQSKYYFDITRIMMEKTFAIFKNRKEQVSINLSLRDIVKSEMQEYILTMIRNNPDIAQRLCLEILEEEGMMNADAVGRFIAKVKEYGVTMAIDDFGSGYSNFKRLIDLHTDYLKIDGSIIQTINSNQAARHLLMLITEFAKKEQLQLVAEYVESKEIADEVVRLGIHFSQGYYFGKPDRL